MGIIDIQIMQVFLTVEKNDLLKWLNRRCVEFLKDDASLPALQYFINDYFDEIIRDYLKYDGLQIKEIKIEEKSENKLKLIFESGLLYPSLHDVNKKRNLGNDGGGC